MLKNGNHAGRFDTLVSYFQRTTGHGTIAGTESVSAHTHIRVHMQESQRWKAATEKIDIARVLMFETWHMQDLRPHTTYVRYRNTDYKVTDVEIIGRRQYMKVTAIQDYNQS